MKKFLIAALLTVTVATSGFTADEKRISSRVLDNFKADYGEAGNVTWISRDNYVKASFMLNGEKTDVFYDHQGETIGTSRKITLESLPVHAKRTFAKKYSDYTVKEAIEFEGVEETAFFISAENEKHSVILKVTTAGVSLHSKTQKK
jgi:hypothetical protein